VPFEVVPVFRKIGITRKNHSVPFDHSCWGTVSPRPEFTYGQHCCHSAVPMYLLSFDGRQIICPVGA